MAPGNFHFCTSLGFNSAMFASTQSMLAVKFVVTSKEFRSFLEIPRNVDNVPNPYPTEIKRITDPQFGVNDFVYDERDLVIFTACEVCSAALLCCCVLNRVVLLQDVHTLSRIDSHISNFRLPWEKPGDSLAAHPTLELLTALQLAQTGCIVPIGSFNCWKLDKEGNWKATCTLLCVNSRRATTQLLTLNLSLIMQLRLWCYCNRLGRCSSLRYRASPPLAHSLSSQSCFSALIGRVGERTHHFLLCRFHLPRVHGKLNLTFQLSVCGGRSFLLRCKLLLRFLVASSSVAAILAAHCYLLLVLLNREPQTGCE